MKIFIDVDNTILEHTSFYNKNTEGRIHSIFSYDPDSNKKAIKAMYEMAVCSDQTNIKKIIFRDNFYILTKRSNEVYEKYKRIRLAEILDITVEELLDLKDSKGRKKYIDIEQSVNKGKFVCDYFGFSDLSNCVLIDDYSQNLIEWEKEKGHSIKFHNEYNSCLHPIGGLVISNFKIFDITSDEMKIKNIVSCSTLKNQFEKEFPEINFINFLKVLKRDIVKRFSIESKIYETTKNSYSMFLKEYYSFIMEHNFTDIEEEFEKFVQKDKVNMIINPFNYDTTHMKELVKNREIITIGFSSTENSQPIRDIYFSVPESEYYDFKEQKILNIMALFRNLR